MIITKTIELGDGKELRVQKNHGGGSINIHGAGSYASLSKAQARALYGALRELDSEGLLNDES